MRQHGEAPDHNVHPWKEPHIMATRTVSERTRSTTPPVGGPQLTREQFERLAGLFEEIAIHAEACDRTFYFLPAGSVDEAEELALNSVRNLTQVVGWLADLGCGLTGGIQQREGDPERWMRAPAYVRKTGGAQ